MPKYRIWDNYEQTMITPTINDCYSPQFLLEMDGVIWTWDVNDKPNAKPKIGKFIKNKYDLKNPEFFEKSLSTYAPDDLVESDSKYSYTYQSRYMIMCCTEVKDCAGNEIYEGDILAYYDARYGLKKAYGTS